MQNKFLFLVFSRFLLVQSLFGYQDNIVPKGIIYPYFFAELVDVQIDRDYLYVSGVGGLMIVEAKNPDNPVQAGHYDPGSIWQRFYTSEIAGNLAIGAARLDGLYLLDISNRRDPKLIRVFKLEGVSIEATAIAGNRLFAAAHDEGLLVIDITDPHSPILEHQYRFFHNVWDIELIEGGGAVIADGPGGVSVLDLSDPANIQVLSTLPTSGNAREVHIRRNDVYAAVGSYGMDIIDISNRRNPIFISNYNSTGVTNHLDVGGNYAFLATWKNVEVVDIFDRSSPALVATEKTPVRAMGVAVRGDSMIYVADWAQFEVYRFHNRPNPDIDVIPLDIRINSHDPVPVTTRNVGNEPLTITNITIANDDFAISPYPSSILPHQEGTFLVQYTGSFSTPVVQRLRILSNDPDESETTPLVVVDNTRFGIGSVAKDFTLTDIHGTVHSLNQYRGKVVVLVFFASW